MTRFQISLKDSLKDFPIADALNWAAGFGVIGVAAVASWTCVNLLAPPPPMSPILSEADQITYNSKAGETVVASDAKARIAEHTIRGEKVTYDASADAPAAKGRPAALDHGGNVRTDEKQTR